MSLAVTDIYEKNGLKAEINIKGTRTISIPASAMVELRKGAIDIEDRKKLLAYLLDRDKKVPEIRLRDNKICELRPVLKQVRVWHDPVPWQILTLQAHESLEKTQWHVLRHGFIDGWLNKKPTVLPWNNKEDLKQALKDFSNQVGCPRWSLNPKKLEQSKKFWKERLDSHTKSYYSKQTISGCADCILEHGVDTFIRCLDFFTDYRASYLRQVRKWAVDTIQDNPCLYFYLNGGALKANGPAPKRKHVHIDQRTRNQLFAYIKEPRNDFIDVFVMIYGLRPSKADTLQYLIKTVYGIGHAVSETEAGRWIRSHAHYHYYRSWSQNSSTCKIKCHPINWQ